MDSSAQTSISVALLDTHRILRDGLECLIDRNEDLSVVGSVATVAEQTTCFSRVQVDVLVMGLVLGGEDALRCISDWSKEYPATRFLVLSLLPESIYAERALQAGACGYLMKDIQATELIEGIRRAAAGEVVVSPGMANTLITNLSRKPGKKTGSALKRLTDRELHVLSMVGQGHLTAAIATSMGISPKTVSTYKERIKVKLALESNQQLTHVAMHHLGRMH